MKTDHGRRHERQLDKQWVRLLEHEAWFVAGLATLILLLLFVATGAR